MNSQQVCFLLPKCLISLQPLHLRMIELPICLTVWLRIWLIGLEFVFDYLCCFVFDGVFFRDYDHLKERRHMFFFQWRRYNLLEFVRNTEHFIRAARYIATTADNTSFVSYYQITGIINSYIHVDLTIHRHNTILRSNLKLHFSSMLYCTSIRRSFQIYCVYVSHVTTRNSSNSLYIRTVQNVTKNIFEYRSRINKKKKSCVPSGGINKIVIFDWFTSTSLHINIPYKKT